MPSYLRSHLVLVFTFFCSSALTAEVQYNRDVLPILAENCFACHGFDEATREAGLRLDLPGDNDSVLGAATPEESELILRITSNDPDSVMPPPESKKQLTESQKNTLRQWVKQGAEYETHWSFVAPTRPELPTVAGASNPIDRFVQDRLKREGMKPAPRASLATLVRRVSLDLTGLPPTIDQIEAFEAAAKKDFQAAWTDLVEELLASPHYGERWGRWWLDQARYADSNGYSIDGPRSIWKYRDWVVAALNDDMPFDQFTIEQLAGDLLPNATLQQKIATGFHRNTQINQEGGIDREQFRIDSIFDRVATTGTVWLGLTIGCAQCHDHKFDPIQQKEFYQLFAFLNNQDEPSIKAYEADLDVDAVKQAIQEAKDQLSGYFSENQERTQDWENGLDDEQKKKLSSAARKALGVEKKKRNFDHLLAIFQASPLSDKLEFTVPLKRYQDNKKILDDTPTTMVLSERREPRSTHILIKGDFTRKSDQVFPGTPAVLHAMPRSDKPNRLDLAKWIVDSKNPLTARVVVNRIWQQYFGKGLVATENDFGLLGSQPTHPKLLDWLATEWKKKHWSLKEIHRLVVTSHTYQQSSRTRQDLMAVDADNLLLARQTRQRLDAELVRDVALVASGLLVPKLGGPPVFPPIADGVMSQGQVRRSWNTSTGDDRYRRGMYTFIYRATPPPSLSVFDAPDGFSSCTRRNRSNTPLQSLALMNDLAFFECAQALEKIITDDGIEVAFRRCTSRQPEPEDLEILSRLDSLTAARALLNLDETITRE